MYELDGVYKSEAFILKINQKNFYLLNNKEQEICAGFIIYISSYVLANKKTKLALTNRQIIWPDNSLACGSIKDMYYQNKTITISYIDENKKKKSTLLQKID